jgi:hypothetical protein
MGEYCDRCFIWVENPITPIIRYPNGDVRVLCEECWYVEFPVKNEAVEIIDG